MYCSDGFCELTGYARAELMQKSCACNFLYGAETSDRLTAQIQSALDDRREFKTELVFYKKGGERKREERVNKKRENNDKLMDCQLKEMEFAVCV